MLQLIFISLFVCSLSLPINDDPMSQPDFFEGDIAGINIESSEVIYLLIFKMKILFCLNFLLKRI